MWRKLLDSLGIIATVSCLVALLGWSIWGCAMTGPLPGRMSISTFAERYGNEGRWVVSPAHINQQLALLSKIPEEMFNDVNVIIHGMVQDDIFTLITFNGFHFGKNVWMSLTIVTDDDGDPIEAYKVNYAIYVEDGDLRIMPMARGRFGPNHNQWDIVCNDFGIMKVALLTKGLVSFKDFPGVKAWMTFELERAAKSKSEVRS